MWFGGRDEFVYLCADMHSEGIPRSRRTDRGRWKSESIPCYRAQSLRKSKNKKGRCAIEKKSKAAH